MIYLFVKLHSHKGSKDSIIEIIYDVKDSTPRLGLEDVNFMEEIIGMYAFKSDKFKKGNYISGPKKSRDGFIDNSFIRIEDVKIITQKEAKKLILDKSDKLNGYIISRKKKKL